MLKRPLLLKLFILYLLLDPFMRTLFLSIEKGFPLDVVIGKSFSLGWVDVFNYWLLLPLTGISLWFVNVYSLLLFILTQAYSLYFHLNYESYSWPYLSETPSGTAYLLLSINLFIVLYLLLPRSRELFSNRSLRWWERGGRYIVKTPCYISHEAKLVKGILWDISFSGAYVKLDEPIALQSNISLDFDILNSTYTLEGHVVRQIDEKKHSYGIRFFFPTYLSSLKFKFLMFFIGLNKSYERYR